MVHMLAVLRVAGCAHVWLAVRGAAGDLLPGCAADTQPQPARGCVWPWCRRGDGANRCPPRGIVQAAGAGGDTRRGTVSARAAVSACTPTPHPLPLLLACVVARHWRRRLRTQTRPSQRCGCHLALCRRWHRRWRRMLLACEPRVHRSRQATAAALVTTRRCWGLCWMASSSRCSSPATATNAPPSTLGSHACCA